MSAYDRAKFERMYYKLHPNFTLTDYRAQGVNELSAEWSSYGAANKARIENVWDQYTQGTIDNIERDT